MRIRRSVHAVRMDAAPASVQCKRTKKPKVDVTDKSRFPEERPLENKAILGSDFTQNRLLSGASPLGLVPHHLQKPTF